MAGTIKLEVAAPDRLLYEGEVTDLQAPAADGYMGVLPGHAALITELSSGVLTFHASGEARYMAVHGGLMEVLPDRVRVLTSAGEWETEVDIERAKVALDRATDLFHEHDYEADVEAAQAAVARARARIAAYERSRTK